MNLEGLPIPEDILGLAVFAVFILIIQWRNSVEIRQRFDRQEQEKKDAAIEAQRIVNDLAQSSQERIDELTDKLGEQSDKVTKISAQLVAAQQARVKAEGILKGQIESLGRQIAEKDAQIKTIKDAAATREQALLERVEKLERRVEEMAAALKVKDNHIKALEGENVKLKGEAELHKSERAKWQLERAELKGRIETVESERDTLLTRISMIEERTEKLETSTGSIPIIKETETNENPSDNTP